MTVEFHIAKRYLTDRRHGTWGWMISWLATGSVAVGVGALIITLGVMTGFRQDIQDKILGVQPHIIISGGLGQFSPTDPELPKVLNSYPDVQAWSPYVSGQGLIGRGSMTSGAMIKGVDPDLEPQIARLSQKIKDGNWEDLKGPPTENKGTKPGIFLGIELARNIGAHKGDIVWVMVPESSGFSALSFPRANLFQVRGFVQSGLYDYDSSLAYVKISDAQKIFDMGTMISGIGVRLKNPDDAVPVAKDLQLNFLKNYWVRSWLSLNKNLFSALKLEKTVMFIILTLVTVVASVMIVSNLLLIITQKTRDIGILRAMGATSGSIRKIFLYQGLLMGLIGNLIGVMLGIGISVILAKTQLIRLPPDVYYIDNLPVKISGLDVLSVVVAAGAIILLASLYPAQRAAKLDPIEAIRYG